MKRILILSTMISLATMMFILCRTTVYAGGYLQYNGVYACYSKADDMPYIEYYRFYPDKTVISVASTGSLAQIQGWFTKEGGGEFGRGKITQVQSNKVSFYTRQSGKQYKYSGEIDGDSIRIKESRWLWGKDTIKFVRFNGPTFIEDCR